MNPTPHEPRHGRSYKIRGLGPPCHLPRALQFWSCFPDCGSLTSPSASTKEEPGNKPQDLLSHLPALALTSAPSPPESIRSADGSIRSPPLRHPHCPSHADPPSSLAWILTPGSSTTGSTFPAWSPHSSWGPLKCTSPSFQPALLIQFGNDALFS